MIAVTISSLSNKMKILFILFTISAPLSAEWLPDVKILQSASAYTAHLIDRALQSGFSHVYAESGDCANQCALKGDLWRCGARISSLMQRVVPPKLSSVKGVLFTILNKYCHDIESDGMGVNFTDAPYESMWIGVRFPIGPEFTGDRKEPYALSKCVVREKDGGVRHCCINIDLL